MGQRSQSPNPSISLFASSFAQRVGSFVSTVGSAVSSGLPTDEELEREAERDRERSRREAELILTQEAEERRQMEEKVLAMLNITATTPKRVSPARSQSMPRRRTPPPLPPPPLSATARPPHGGALPEPSHAHKRATHRRTASHSRSQGKRKREKKGAKKVEKERKRSADWPAVPESKFNNPTLLSLITHPAALTPGFKPSLSAPPSRRLGSRPSIQPST